VDGLELEYDVIGDGPELVWLHGLGGNLDDGRLLAERLASDHRVLWYSTRGHGGSTPVLDRSAYRYDRIATDLEAMLDVAGFSSPLLVGGSHGANTILRHEAMFPGRARALMLIAPGGNALQRVSQRYFLPMRVALWRAARGGDDRVLAFALGADPSSPDIDPDLLRAARAHDPRSLVAALRHIPDQRAVDPEALRAFDVPTHVVAWDHDPIIHPLAVAKRIVDLIPGATFELIERDAQMRQAAVADYAATVIRRWTAAIPV
jgi:pimeloyl-ACP methyl ester carboxylesterase